MTGHLQSEAVGPHSMFSSSPIDPRTSMGFMLSLKKLQLVLHLHVIMMEHVFLIKLVPTDVLVWQAIPGITVKAFYKKKTAQTLVAHSMGTEEWWKTLG